MNDLLWTERYPQRFLLFYKQGQDDLDYYAFEVMSVLRGHSLNDQSFGLPRGLRLAWNLAYDFANCSCQAAEAIAGVH